MKMDVRDSETRTSLRRTTGHVHFIVPLWVNVSGISKVYTAKLFHQVLSAMVFPVYYHQYFISGDVAFGEGVMQYFITISKLQFGFSLDLGKALTILKVNMHF